MDALERCGVVIESRQQGILSFTQPGKIPSTAIAFGGSAEYVAQLRHNTMSGSRRVANLKNNRWLGGPAPYGFCTELRQEGKEAFAYLVLCRQPIPGNGDLTEVDVVRDVHRMAREGLLAGQWVRRGQKVYSAIAAHLNRQVSNRPTIP